MCCLRCKTSQNHLCECARAICWRRCREFWRLCRGLCRIWFCWRCWSWRRGCISVCLVRFRWCSLETIQSACSYSGAFAIRIFGKSFSRLCKCPLAFLCRAHSGRPSTCKWSRGEQSFCFLGGFSIVLGISSGRTPWCLRICRDLSMGRLFLGFRRSRFCTACRRQNCRSGLSLLTNCLAWTVSHLLDYLSWHLHRSPSLRDFGFLRFVFLAFAPRGWELRQNAGSIYFLNSYVASPPYLGRRPQHA